jgi:hypothetical protein
LLPSTPNNKIITIEYSISHVDHRSLELSAQSASENAEEKADNRSRDIVGRLGSMPSDKVALTYRRIRLEADQ